MARCNVGVGVEVDVVRNTVRARVLCLRARRCQAASPLGRKIATTGTEEGGDKNMHSHKPNTRNNPGKVQP